MPWILTAVVLAATCWFIAALSSEQGEDGEAPRLGKVAADATHAIWSFLRASGRAVARGLAAAGRMVGQFWRETRSQVGRSVAARRERRGERVRRPRKVRFEQSFILTGPEEAAEPEEAVLQLSGVAPRPSAVSRLMSLVELLFLVILWGGAAALTIAGVAWAVTRIV